MCHFIYKYFGHISGYLLAISWLLISNNYVVARKHTQRFQTLGIYEQIWIYLCVCVSEIYIWIFYGPEYSPP